MLSVLVPYCATTARGYHTVRRASEGVELWQFSAGLSFSSTKQQRLPMSRHWSIVITTSALRRLLNQNDASSEVVLRRKAVSKQAEKRHESYASILKDATRVLQTFARDQYFPLSGDAQATAPDYFTG